MKYDRPTMIYDGDCGFCKRAIGYILARDRHNQLGCAANTEEPAIKNDPELWDRTQREMLLIDGDTVYGGSQAALRSWVIIRPWTLLRIFLIPPFSWIASVVYKWIARHRMLASRILRIPATCDLPRARPGKKTPAP